MGNVFAGHTIIKTQEILKVLGATRRLESRRRQLVLMVGPRVRLSVKACRDDICCRMPGLRRRDVYVEVQRGTLLGIIQVLGS